jgi:hypothetical protein
MVNSLSPGYPRGVPVFASEQDVYGKIGRMLAELVADPLLCPQFQRADTIVQFHCVEPEATITVDLRIDADAHVVTGPTETIPEITMEMAADVAHGFFLGRVNVPIALARGQITATGPVAKILKLVPLIRPSFPRYRALLEAQGTAASVPVPA